MQTFPKHERLCYKPSIDRLFQSGKGFHASPFRVLWQEPLQTADTPVRVIITVSKRRFPSAVVRNTLRRRIREAYRRQKDTFISFLRASGRTCELGLIYCGSGNESSTELERKILLLLQRLQNAYEKTAG